MTQQNPGPLVHQNHSLLEGDRGSPTGAFGCYLFYGLSWLIVVIPLTVVSLMPRSNSWKGAWSMLFVGTVGLPLFLLGLLVLLFALSMTVEHRSLRTLLVLAALSVFSIAFWPALDYLPDALTGAFILATGPVIVGLSAHWLLFTRRRLRRDSK